jgi:acyl-CoA synthetase (NDP forming)
MKTDRDSALLTSDLGTNQSPCEKTVSDEAIDKIFKTKSIAVVGASGDRSKYGFMTLDTLMRGGYEGAIYPVNPKGGEILGLKTYKSLREIPGALDLVLIIVPVKFVASVLKEASEKGAVGAIICSGGFREAGRPDLEDELKQIGLKGGIRLLGPNISGIAYLPNQMCAQFFPVFKVLGAIAVISQSGSVTTGLCEWACEEGVGISAGINLGNQVDINESHYLNYFGKDFHTKVILMYLEGVSNGRVFLSALEKTVRKKPVVIIKGGRTEAGLRSTASHTGAMGSSYEIFAAACRQAGAVVVRDIETAYDCAKALATIPRLAGNRLVSVSTSGGANTLAMDEIDSHDLKVSSLPEKLVKCLSGLNLSPLADFSNPVDLAGIVTDHFRKTVLEIDRQEAADVVLLNFADPMVDDKELVEELGEKMRTPLAISYFAGGEQEKKGKWALNRSGFPVFSAPERAIRGISSCYWFSEYLRKREVGDPKDDNPYGKTLRKNEIKAPVLEPKVVELISRYGVPYPDFNVVKSLVEAADSAEKIGFPVVMKVVSPDVIHKTEVGGVITDIADRKQVKLQYHNLLKNIAKAVPGAELEGVMVCKQAPEGLDLIAGCLTDPVFGPTVMVGLGGIYTEIFHDVSFRIAPLRRIDAEEMIRELKGYRILKGVRGQRERDIPALINLLLSLSRMVTENPEIKEIDLNPVRLYSEKLLALDARLFTNKDSR